MKADWKYGGLTWEQFGDFSQDDINGLKTQWFPQDAVKRGQLQSVWIKHHDRQQGGGADGSSIDKLVKTVENMAVDQKRVNFAMKLMTDSLPPNIGVVNPSEDCKTDKSGKYRALMRALRMNEENNVMSLAASIDQQECSVAEFSFTWKKSSKKDKDEGESYEPFQTYLKTDFKMNAVILGNGEGLADGNLFVSDIFTLRPKLGDLTSDLKKAALGQEPQFRFRIRGKTDLGIFREGGVVGCGDLLIAFEIKPKKKFSSTADINRALREGVLQLVGTNADNHYSSPVVIVTALVGDKLHYLLYLELGCDPETELRYHLRVRSSASLSQLIHFAQTLCERDCITSRFAAPPTPTGSPPHNSPEKGEKEQEDEEEEDEDFDADNVSIESA